MADESDVNNGDDGEGQAANRSKVATVPVHRSSHGIAPKEYLEENIVVDSIPIVICLTTWYS